MSSMSIIRKFPKLQNLDKNIGRGAVSVPFRILWAEKEDLSIGYERVKARIKKGKGEIRYEKI